MLICHGNRKPKIKNEATHASTSPPPPLASPWRCTHDVSCGGNYKLTQRERGGERVGEKEIARERERDMCVSATIDDVPQTEAWAVVQWWRLRGLRNRCEF